MEKVQGKLTDDKVLEVVCETTVLDVASSLSHGLKSEDELQLIRHSAAHLLAHAMRRIYGQDSIRLGIGPVIENGFYYDFEVLSSSSISVDDFPRIEQVMQQIVAEDLPIQRESVSRTEAVDLFRGIGESLKVEIIEGFPEDAEITIYRQGEFFDLCRGPHVPSTGALKSFRLMSVAGAYWRGDSKNKMLQRIYGTAFANQSELDEYLELLEQAKQRDHRRLAKDLELFMFSEDAPGMPFYLHNGLVVRNELEQYERSLQARDYEEVRTPLMMNERFWQQSGHIDKYGENMYFVNIDEERYALKPMSCPGHMLIYKNKSRSYRDLPLRLAEYGICHRHELSGALSGLTRVRAFTQDDAHIFVRPDQIHGEIATIINLIDEIYKVFGFQYKVELSTRPENSLGSDELWQQAESALADVLNSKGMNYQVNAGDGAFYGPKIDFHIKDALSRSWQCGTIQLDFQLPERLDLNYVGEDGQKYRPVVIHRAIFGSMERFIGMLIEHFGGAFPLWLAPIQVKILPVAQRHQEAATALKDQLLEHGVRVEVDDRNEKFGYKIRDAQVKKVPYALVLGDKEIDAACVSVRKHGAGDLGVMPAQVLVNELLAAIRSKSL